MQVVGSGECRVCVASWDKAIVGLQQIVEMAWCSGSG